MNSQLGLLIRGRQFWAGVAASVFALLLVVEGVPNLLRSRIAAQRMGSYYQMQTKSVSVAGGGGGGGGDRVQTMNYLAMEESPGYDDGRKMARNASMELIVKNPKDISESIRKVAEDAGGFLVSSETNNGANTASSLTIRVPVNKFDEVRGKIARLGVQVASEKVDAEDVTKQYVDLSARLRNLRAQETQYLGILKQARTVKDTVEVSEKLNEVRSQIDQQQAEFDALWKQV